MTEWTFLSLLFGVIFGAMVAATLLLLYVSSCYFTVHEMLFGWVEWLVDLFDIKQRRPPLSPFERPQGYSITHIHVEVIERMIYFIWDAGRDLRFSFQMRSNNMYFDFASRQWLAEPPIPRAAMQMAAKAPDYVTEAKQAIYAGRARINPDTAGEVYVTIRDVRPGTKTPTGALTETPPIVAVLIYKIYDGQITPAGVTDGLRQFTPEVGLPPAEFVGRPVHRRTRAIEVD